MSGGLFSGITAGWTAIQWTEAGLLGFGGLLVTAAVTVIGTRRAFLGKKGENDNAKAKIESEAMSEALSSNITLDAYIEGKIEARVAPLQVQIDELKRQHATVTGGFRDYVLETNWWDRTGREGGLPQASPDMLKLLGLSHLLSTPSRLSGLDDTVPAYHERDHDGQEPRE